jgi:P-type Ca2+ transporter type 2C
MINCKTEKWHTLAPGKALEILFSSENGLSQREAEDRLEKYGSNEIIVKKRSAGLVLFFSQFKSMLVAVLCAAAILSFAFSEMIDFAVIVVVIIINALLGFYQERKAENALDQLKKMAVSKTIVMRGGSRIEIDSSQIVPGDILLLREGDKVPSDCRILECNRLKIDESVLTGESMPSDKKSQEVSDAKINEQANMAFCGTSVVLGTCKALAVRTGMETEFGKIALSLSEPEEPTPLQRRLSVLGKQLTGIIILVAAVIFAFGYAQGFEVFEMLEVAITISVAAIPEGLPAVVTITLAVGLIRMSRRNAIVRRLPATESLGSVTVICTDKTGTLTKNEMTVRSIYADGKKRDFDSCDRDSDGVQTLLLTALVCNDATESSGDPTEAALVRAAKKFGLDDIRQSQKRLAEIPFDAQRKMMSVAYETNGKNVFTKGAPEEVLKRCRKTYFDKRVQNLTDKERLDIISAYEEMAASAMRVLAFAYKPMGKEISEQDMVFCGLVGMIDPPRPEALESIAKCKCAGIRVIMITGDHHNTAQAIAKEIGIEGRALKGDELDAMNDREFEKAVKEINIYSRTTPEQKQRITCMLQKSGNIVAMTGDGVNDAPALKKADIGIAVGSGTPVTKEAADIVLIDDNFASIVSAVEEGRGIYENIRKFVNFMLCSNFSELMVILVGLALGLPLPLLPLQILWMNLLTDGFPALALGAEAVDKDIMKKKPKDPKENILGKQSICLILGVAAIIAVQSLMIFSRYLPNEAKARTACFTMLVAAELVLAFNFKSMGPVLKKSILSNRKLIIAVMASFLMQLSVIYIHELNSVFETVPLDLSDWAGIAGMCLVMFALVEFVKGAVAYAFARQSKKSGNQTKKLNKNQNKVKEKQK